MIEKQDNNCLDFCTFQFFSSHSLRRILIGLLHPQFCQSCPCQDLQYLLCCSSAVASFRDHHTLPFSNIWHSGSFFLSESLSSFDIHIFIVLFFHSPLCQFFWYFFFPGLLILFVSWLRLRLNAITSPNTLKCLVRVHAFLNVTYMFITPKLYWQLRILQSTSGSYLTFLLECLIDTSNLAHPKLNSMYFLQICFFHKSSCIS